MLGFFVSKICLTPNCVLLRPRGASRHLCAGRVLRPPPAPELRWLENARNEGLNRLDSLKQPTKLAVKQLVDSGVKPAIDSISAYQKLKAENAPEVITVVTQ